MFNLLGDNSNDFLHSLFYNNFKTRQNKPMMLTREEVEVNPAIYDNLGFNTWSESLLQPRGKVIDKHVLHTRNLLRQITPKRKSVEAFYNQAECMPGLIINADNNSVCYRDRLNNLQPLVNNGNKLSNMFKDQRKAQHPLLYLWIDNFKNQQNKREVIFRTPHWRNNKHIQYKKWV
jgi:hypothetical protein